MIVDNSHVFLQFSELGVHVQSEASQEIEIITWDKIKKKETSLVNKNIIYNTCIIITNTYIITIINYYFIKFL